MKKEKPKVKSLNVKDSIENVKSFFLKFALKRQRERQTSTELQKGREKSKENSIKISLEGKEPLQFKNRDPIKNNILKNLAKDKYDVAKDKVGNAIMMVKNELKDDGNNHLQCIAEVVSRGGKGKNDKMQEVNSGKDYGGVRDLMKVKSEAKDFDRGKEKGMNLVAKNAFLKTKQQLTNNASKTRPKSTNYVGTSSNFGQLHKKKLMQTKAIATATMKIVMEQRKEKRVYFLPGQKHDPPEDRDPLRIFYSTLREQVPESGMAEFWLMEYGLLPQDQAKKALERKQRKGQTLKYGTLHKSSMPSKLSSGALKNLIPIFNDKGKNKRVESNSNNYDVLGKIRSKKKLKV